MLYGTAETEPQADIVVAQLAQELYNSNLLLLLVQNLSRIDFEVHLFYVPYMQQYTLSQSHNSLVYTKDI